MRKYRGFLLLVLVVTSCVAMMNCSGDNSNSENDTDSIVPDQRAVMPLEDRYDSLPDSLSGNYQSVMREVERLRVVRNEQDNVLNFRLNEERQISNNEPESDRSEAMVQKQRETQQLHELQKLDDEARPLLRKIEMATRRETPTTAAEMSRMLEKLHTIRGRQLDIAYELADGKLIKEYRREIEKIYDIEMNFDF